MGSEVHGVDPRDRTSLACERADPFRVRERTGRIGGERERDNPCSLPEPTLEIVVVDGQLVGDPRDLHGQPLVGSELDPGGNTAVVVELGGEHLVA